MIQLCTKYARFNPKIDPLGYGGIGALISFAHGMPNNAPVIFYQGSQRGHFRWNPLYPQRVTFSRRGDDDAKAIRERRYRKSMDLHRATKKRVLSSPRFRSAPLALRDAVHVLLTLDRGPRTMLVLSARSGLSVERVESALTRIERYGWADDDLRITERGRLELARLGSPVQKGVQFGSGDVYIPRSLRAPRAV